MLVLADLRRGLWYKGLPQEKTCLGFPRLRLGEAVGILVDFPTAQKAGAMLLQQRILISGFQWT